MVPCIQQCYSVAIIRFTMFFHLSLSQIVTSVAVTAVSAIVAAISVSAPCLRSEEEQGSSSALQGSDAAVTVLAAASTTFIALREG